MKGCALGGVVLAVVIALVVGNAVFINRTVRDLTAGLDALPPVPDSETTPAEIAALREALESKEALLGLSVSYEEMDKAVESLRGLEASAAAGDVSRYRATLEILRDLMEDLARLEKLSVKNLL